MGFSSFLVLNPASSENASFGVYLVLPTNSGSTDIVEK